jgi:hypothetical protein
MSFLGYVYSTKNKSVQFKSIRGVFVMSLSPRVAEPSSPRGECPKTPLRQSKLDSCWSAEKQSKNPPESQGEFLKTPLGQSEGYPGGPTAEQLQQSKNHQNHLQIGALPSTTSLQLLQIDL